MKGSDECPRCGSGNVAFIAIHQWESHAACMKCETIWEPFNADHLQDPDDTLSCFKSPCDNCAFRGDSPERADPEKWELLMQEINLKGGVFYCHKGTPLMIGDPDQSHDHPKNDKGHPETNKMRLCAGYIQCMRKFGIAR